MSVLEARAAGTAVICSDRGGLPEMVTHGVDGILVDVTSGKPLAEAASRLFRDAALRRRLADNGLTRLNAQHSGDQHYARLLEIYRGVIARRARLDVPSRRDARFR